MWRWASAARSALHRPAVHAPVIAAVLGAAVIAYGPGRYYAFLIGLTLIYVVAALGLSVSAGFLGQLNLGQGAAMALGGYTAAYVIADLGLGIILGLVAALVVGALAGVVIAIPAARLRLIGIALVTIGFTLVASDAANAFRSITGGPTGKLGITGGLLPGGQALGATGRFVLVLVVATVVYLLHTRLRLSPFGRACLAIRDDDIGASAYGLNPYRYKVVGFTIGTSIGAVAGALYAVSSQVIAPGVFGIHLSVLVLLMVILGGQGTRFGPIIGAAIIGLIPIILAGRPEISVYVYGALLILLVRLLPTGLIRRTGERADMPALSATPEQTSDPTSSKDVEPVLAVRGLHKSFNGVHALDGVSLQIRPGEIHGIVGSNGSGKTTLLNVVCGYYDADAGEVVVAGAVQHRTVPVAVARAGLSRTFQVPKVFPSLTVGENLAIAATAVVRHAPAVERQVRAFITDSGLGALQDAQVSTLSHGQLRFLEISMAALRGPHILLLDEPAAGLGADELEGLGTMLQALVNHGVAVVLVEHHLDWVKSLADRIHVMHVGQVLWAGEPDDLAASEEVRSAYLGVE